MRESVPEVACLRSTSPRARDRGERGAVLVHTAIVSVVLLGLGAFVIDYGILWVSREQAQNAADAGAMAGAVAHAWDGPDLVVPSATRLVAANPVWFAPAVSQTQQGACPAGANGASCVRVDVYRDGTTGSAALPMVFGPILNITSQGVRATATAQVGIGNSTPCLAPWAIPDRWIERRPVNKPWEPGDVFERYQEGGPGAGTLLSPADEYTPPDPGGEGTGLTVPIDLGQQLTIAFADPLSSDPIRPGFLLPIDLPGATTYEQDIVSCSGQRSGLGQQMSLDVSATETATTDGIAALIADDPGASWNAGLRRIQGTCAPTCAPISPRLVALAVFDVDEYQYMRATDVWCAGGVRCVTVVNMVGFFLESVTGSGAVGYVTKYPGLISSSFPLLQPASSFLPAVSLVR